MQLDFLGVSNAVEWVRSALGRAEQTLVIDSPEEAMPRQHAPAKTFDTLGSLIPVTGYDEETKLFLIEGAEPKKLEGVGFTLELSPQVGADRSMADRLLTMFQTNMPTGTGFQFQIFGGPAVHEVTNLMRAYSISPDDVPGAEEMLRSMQDYQLACARAKAPFSRENFLKSNPQFVGVMTRIDQTRVLRRIVEQRIAYYEKLASQDVFPGLNSRMRSYRATLSVVVPGSKVDEPLMRHAVEIRESLQTLLSQFHMFDFVWEARDYVQWMRMMLNPHRMLATSDSPSGLPPAEYDDGREIRRQLVLADTRSRLSETGITFSAHDMPPVTARFMSVNAYPRDFGLHHMLNLLGSDTSTGVGYPCPFMITMGVAIPDRDQEKARVTTKAMRAQQTADSQISRYIPQSQDVNNDYKIAQLAHDQGAGTCKLYHQIAVFGAPDMIDRCEQSARSVWSAERFAIAVDVKMQLQALLASLPMMYGPLLQRDMNLAGRTSTKTFFNAANLMPVLAEWRGTPPRSQEKYRRPVLTFAGRRGQIFNVDLFANPGGNYNSTVFGAPGGGKSVFLNELIHRTLDQGGRVWVIDIGRSYEALCKSLKGQYLEFQRSKRMSLNPFSLVAQMERQWKAANDKDADNDASKELDIFVKPFVAQALAPTTKLDDWRLSMLKTMIEQVYLDRGEGADLTLLAQYLIANCEQGGSQLAEGYGGFEGLSDEERSRLKRGPRGQVFDPTRCDPEIRKLGQQLHAFAETNGHYFSGAANVDFDSNFVVLELEELNDNPPLRDAVLQMLMYRIANEMYQGSRKRPKLVLIDEGWALLGGSGGGQNFANGGSTASFIEGGYRKARKYFGSFTVASHGVIDMVRSETGQAVLAASDWMFLLRQNASSIDALAATNKLKLDEYTQRLLRSLTTVKGQYSEIFIKCEAFPPTVGRFFMDAYSGLLSSSAPEDFEAVRAYTARGLPMEQAIEAVLRDRAAARH